MQTHLYILNEINIDNYNKINIVKHGGFGTVYKIEEKDSKEIYAAKVLNFNHNEEEYKQMIDREISILRIINHPTIINFIGYSLIDFQHDDNVTIIMKYAVNGSLADVLKQVQFVNGPHQYTNTTRQIILAGISRGMKYLHDRNLIHRDLKPGNILLDENFHPLITDFGLSKIFQMDQSDIQSQIGGTLFYMAPEVIECKKYDRKADVYSFAILMYEVVTDLYPYPEMKNGEMTDFNFRNNVVKNHYRPKFKSNIKKPIQNLIEKCWSPNPNERPTFAEIFNKLSNKNGDSSEFLLDDVSIEEFQEYVDEITEINDPIDDLNNKIERIQKVNVQLKTAFDQLNTENRQIKNDSEKFMKDIGQLKEVNGQLIRENDRLKNESNNLKDVNEQIKKENAQFKTVNGQLGLENDRLKMDNEKVNTLNNKLKTVNNEIKAKNIQLNEENNKLKTVNNEIKAKNIQLNEENNKLKTVNDQVNTENRQIKEDNVKFKKSIGRLSTENDNLKEVNDRLSKDNERVNALNDQLKAKVNPRNNHVDKLNKEIDKLKDGKEQLKSAKKFILGPNFSSTISVIFLFIGLLVEIILTLTKIESESDKYFSLILFVSEFVLCFIYKHFSDVALLYTIHSSVFIFIMWDLVDNSHTYININPKLKAFLIFIIIYNFLLFLFSVPKRASSKYYFVITFACAINIIIFAFNWPFIKDNKKTNDLVFNLFVGLIMYAISMNHKLAYFAIYFTFGICSIFLYLSFIFSQKCEMDLKVSIFIVVVLMSIQYLFNILKKKNVFAFCSIFCVELSIVLYHRSLLKDDFGFCIGLLITFNIVSIFNSSYALFLFSLFINTFSLILLLSIISDFFKYKWFEMNLIVITIDSVILAIYSFSVACKNGIIFN